MRDLPLTKQLQKLTLYATETHAKRLSSAPFQKFEKPETKFGQSNTSYEMNGRLPKYYLFFYLFFSSFHFSFFSIMYLPPDCKRRSSFLIIFSLTLLHSGVAG